MAFLRGVLTWDTPVNSSSDDAYSDDATNSYLRDGSQRTTSSGSRKRSSSKFSGIPEVSCESGSSNLREVAELICREL
jgi:hypothetical protein